MYVSPDKSTALRRARASGKATYTSDKPCPQGHVGLRYVSNCACVQCLRAQNKKYRRHNHRFQHYGVTPEQWAAMLAAQKGVCFICGGPPGKHGLHVDHNHQTGAVRALLCGPCNTKVGFWEGVDRDRYINYLNLFAKETP